MRSKQTWSEIIYSKGRYLPKSYYSEEAKKEFVPYKEDKSKLLWNIFVEDNGAIVPVNIFEYSRRFLEDGLLVAKKKYKNNFENFAAYIRESLQYCYWSKSEYETIITTWPPYITKEELDRLNKEKAEYEEKYRLIRGSVNLEIGYKIDIYTQVMMNWDRFIEYVWNNKHLITKKKLGLN